MEFGKVFFIPIKVAVKVTVTGTQEGRAARVSDRKTRTTSVVTGSRQPSERHTRCVLVESGKIFLYPFLKVTAAVEDVRNIQAAVAETVTGITKQAYAIPGVTWWNLVRSFHF